MKYKDPVTGELKDIYVKASDTLPVGSVVDYDGEDIPAGWEQIEDDSLKAVNMKIGESFETNEYLDGKKVYGYIFKFQHAFTKDEQYTIELPFASEMDKAWVDSSICFMDNSKTSETYNVWNLGYVSGSYFMVGILSRNRLAITPNDSWGDSWTYTIMVKYTKK